MSKLLLRQSQLIAEYFSNIAVAWFTVGVIGAFFGGGENFTEKVISVLWGLIISLVFLLIGLYVIKRRK